MRKHLNGIEDGTEESSNHVKYIDNMEMYSGSYTKIFIFTTNMYNMRQECS